MQLTKHDYKYRSFLKMEKRLEVVNQLIRNLPLIKLKEPYQSGWYCVYDFTPAISRRKDIEILREVLRIGYYPYNLISNPDDVRRIRRGETYRSIKKGKDRVSYRPSRIYLSEKEYLSLPPQIKKYFELNMFSELYRKHKIKHYHSILSFTWLVLRIKPRIITHITKKGGALEKEYQFLRDKLNEYWREYFGYSQHFPTGEERTETRAKIRKFIKGEMNDITFNKYKMEYD